MSANVPAWLRKIEVAVLLRSFSRAFGVEPPSLRGQSARETLTTYREFTAACMELAQRDDRVAKLLRARLSDEAQSLGRTVRRLVPGASVRPFALARLLYRGIGIELAGEIPGKLRFFPCSFAARYTPEDCWFMSAFDEGFIRGISGLADANLTFTCRLTQGDSCCLARFYPQSHSLEAGNGH